MSPTIALKRRLEPGRKRSAYVRSAVSASAFRTVSIGSEEEIPIRSLEQASSENEAANLLLSVSSIVSDEMKNNACLFDDDFKNIRANIQSPTNELLLTPRKSIDSIDTNKKFACNRIRTISIDSLSVPSRELAVVSPSNTPVAKGPRSIRKISRRLSKKQKRDGLRLSRMPQLPQLNDMKGQKKKALQASVAKGKPVKKILRKKFSWKNYPELEAFLIANREEYLRHSALNYTVQQKQYNNRLTERLLDVSAEHGYIFDETDFSFVTVRDRIRCYFKSFVQSAKKRGIIIGYAARKAGLLSDEDLEKSAGRKGKIVTPAKS